MTGRRGMTPGRCQPTRNGETATHAATQNSLGYSPTDNTALPWIGLQPDTFMRCLPQYRSGNGPVDMRRPGRCHGVRSADQSCLAWFPGW